MAVRVERGESVTAGEWSYSVDEKYNIMSATARRGFEPVKAEFERRFGR